MIKINTIKAKLAAIPKVISLLEPREKKMFIAVIISAVAVGILQSLSIVSILPFLTLVLYPDAVHENRWLNMVYEGLGFTSEHSFLIFTGLVMLGFIIFGNAASALATWIKVRFIWRNNHNLSSKLMKKYLSLPYIFFLGQHSSNLSRNVLSEVQNFTKSFMMPLVMFITEFFKVSLIIVTITIINPVITILAILLLGGSYTALYYAFRRTLDKAGEERLKANRGRYKASNEAFGGIKDTKVLGREGFFLKRYMKDSLKLSNMQARQALIGSLPPFGMEAITMGGIMALVLFFITAEANVHQVIPMLAVFAIAGQRLKPSLQHLFKSATQVQFSKAVLKSIYRDMAMSGNTLLFSTLMDTELPEPLPFKNTLELQNISFSYPKTKEHVLKNINLTIKRHASIAVAGPTGSGKTTLVDIILGLLIPQQGELKVDGTIVREDNIRNWQRNIGYVPQHIFLSDDTLARNIAFGIPDEEIDREALERAAKFANLYNFIHEELPRGFETVIGERGVRLSGGQRQRVGIARALYYDPEILVLDEATSALDGITEDAVLEAIENASKLKTMIIIAHRLTTVMHCDTIYLMNKGRIEAQGTYNELMDDNIQFRAMAKVAEK